MCVDVALVGLDSALARFEAVHMVNLEVVVLVCLLPGANLVAVERVIREDIWKMWMMVAGGNDAQICSYKKPVKG
jgi:hypothetical protein